MDLTELERLTGAPDRNFEVLTRAIVSRRFAKLGAIRESRQQPGVEFYLVVDHAGELGDPGRVWGWSCKWLKLGQGNELTAGQRGQIEDSVNKAIKHVAGLTDFVLCLPERPARKDVDWIDGIGRGKGITTRLWASENFEAELAGLGELRSTFFGEFVLSPAALAEAHERSVAPVRARWVPPLHTSNHVESRLDRALMRPAAFNTLNAHADAIAARTAAVRAGFGDIDDEAARARAERVADDLDRFVSDLRVTVEAGRALRPTEARDRVVDLQPPVTTPRQLRAFVLDMRKRRLPAALAATGLQGEIFDAIRWLQDTDAEARAPLVAIVAAAGLGKTHLAAQLTAPTGRPIAGVFIQGSRLRAGGTLDDLAHQLPGVKVDRFEDLLEALNWAGARAGARIPVVVDGLNEAERPSEWRALLDELVPALGAYPNVLMIVTLREALAARAVPDAALTVGLEWQRAEVDDLVAAYFDHYLIEPAGAWLPMEMFRNPLFLRMYCEAANPLRKAPVGVEALPTSLIGVFELYRDGVSRRLADDPARVCVPADQIRRRLAELARTMWTRRVRRLPSDDARALLDAGQTNWDESLFRRLEEEGVLFRDEVDGADDTETGLLFDRFAGYLIADALLVRMAYADVDQRLTHPDLWSSLLGDDTRPLGEDVAIGLIGLVPRRFSGQHLWRHAPAEHRPWALTQELDSESIYLDDATIDALVTLLADQNRPPPKPRRPPSHHAFDRLWEVAAAPAHRLNARFLDRVLRLLPLPARDLRWTEWVRHRASELLVPDLNEMITHWTENLERGDTDDLRALTIGWLLTSTNSDVRDLATKALQRYGRPEPKRLFGLATRFLDTDDPYVVERAVGAAFGAASAHQMPDPGGPFEHALGQWLVQLRDRFLTGGSTATSHELLRSFIRATFELAGILHPDATPAGVDPRALTFADLPAAPVMADDDPRVEECRRTLRMDFENYVIGSAIDGRRNYDSDHPGFRRARGEVLARVWDLGWRATLFDEADRAIAEDRGGYGRQRTNVERYGKKYGWIAYYEMIGRLTDRGEHQERWVGGRRNVAHDLDPTFPHEPPSMPLPLPTWAPAGPVDEQAWLRSGAVTVPAELWTPREIHGVTGGWLLAEGFLEHRRDGRRVFAFFHTLLLDAADVAPALELIDGLAYLGNDLFPSLPSMRDVFAGEMPWSPRFEVRFDDEDAFARPALRHDWREEGMPVGQVAVDLATGEGDSPTALRRSYTVPSSEFSARFGLRQLPGTLDLVALDGLRASATFRVEEPWTGQLLFVRRDLVVEFARGRSVLQVAWGERQVTVEWDSVPAWLRAVHQAHEHVWRDRRVLDDP